MCIDPGQGQTALRGWNFNVNRNILSLWSFVASFKKITLKSWFYTIFFHDLIHAYSPGAGADSPQGTQFWSQQKGLIILPICYKFQRNFFEVWFYSFFVFSWFNTCTGRMSKGFMSLQQYFSHFETMEGWTCKVLCNEAPFEDLASGQGQTSPGDKVLMSTETSCHFGYLLLVSNHRRQ